MDNSFLASIVISALIIYISMSVSVYKLLKIKGDDTEKFLIPGLNIYLFFRILGWEKIHSVILTLLLISVPLIGIVFLIIAGGRFAKLTNRPRMVGYILTIPPLSFIGLTILAISSKSINE